MSDFGTNLAKLPPNRTNLWFFERSVYSKSVDWSIKNPRCVLFGATNLTEFSPKSDWIFPQIWPNFPQIWPNFPPNLAEFPPNLAPVAADDSFVLMLDEGSGLRIVSWAIFVLIITPARVSTKTYWFGLKYLRVRKNLGMLFSDTSTHLTHFTWRMRKLYRGWGRIVRLFWGGIILVGKTKRGKEGGGEKTKRKQGSCFE